MAESLIRVGTCPCCGYSVQYDEKKDTVVTCYACEKTSNVADLQGGGGDSSRYDTTQRTDVTIVNGALAAIPQVIAGIETPETAYAYFENILALYDWNDYKSSFDLFVSDFAKFIDGIKIKYATNPLIWYMEFKSVSVPFMKRFEVIIANNKKIGAKYTGVDDTQLLPVFDEYKRVIRIILKNANKIKATIEYDLANAEKFKLESDKLAEIQAEAQKILGSLDVLKAPKKLTETPSVITIYNKKQEAIRADYEAQGIDAKAIYVDAVEKYVFDGQKQEASELFETIPLYKDSKEYLDKIRKTIRFADYFEIGGVPFQCVSKASYANPLNVTALNNKTAKAQSTEPVYDGKMYELFEVVDTKPAEKPVVEKISKILASYKNKLFFIKNNTDICSFDAVTKSEATIVKGKMGDFILGEKDIIISEDKTKCYIKRKLEVKFEKQGCLASLKKKPQVAIVNLNNYSMIEIDMEYGGTRPVINEMINVIYADSKSDKIFYSYYDKQNEKALTRMCDLSNGTTIDYEECEIHGVAGDVVVYSKYSPYSINKLLYSHDLSTDETVLIEKNVYSFYGIVENKVFYVVGNKSFNPLFSANLDGTERTQIMKYVQSADLINGWLYVVKGYMYNKLLFKISIDGKKKILLCSGLKELVADVGEYVYYTDWYGKLKVVRDDGKEDRLVADNMTGKLYIDENYIYCVKNEFKNINSLYRFDIDGTNARKLVFDFEYIAEYDSDSFIIKKKEKAKYEAVYSNPKKKKKAQTPSTITTDLSVTCVYNKYTDEETNLIVTGTPDSKSFKAGCGKPVDVAYKRVPIKIEYNEEVKNEAGSNYINQVVAKTNASRNNTTNKANTTGCNGCGCGKKK